MIEHVMYIDDITGCMTDQIVTLVDNEQGIWVGHRCGVDLSFFNT